MRSIHVLSRIGGHIEAEDDPFGCSCRGRLAVLQAVDCFRMCNILLKGALVVAAFTVWSVAASAGDQDEAEAGPFAVVTSAYKLPAAIDPEVASDIATELWATVYRPIPLGRGPHPLLVFLHGDYATCGHIVPGVGRVDDSIEYTFDGKCPPGYFPIQSQLGYGYAATRLASHGYIIVSINANRGVNYAAPVLGDEGLTLRRGLLVLRHLQAWTHWNQVPHSAPTSLGFEVAGTINFREVGLMGHSRGGEGVRAAVALYKDPDSPWPARLDSHIRFRAMLEIAPIDGASSARTIDANNLTWATLLPLCDNSIPMLDGLKVYDRSIAALTESTPSVKATFAAAGTNHNFFNSIWRAERFREPTDPAYPGGCVDQEPLFDSEDTGSSAEQAIGAAAMLAFFRGTVGEDKDPALLDLFDPGRPLPGWLARLTRFERGYSSSASRHTILPIEDFTNPTGQNSNGPANLSANVTLTHDLVPEHEVMAGVLSWDRSNGSASADTFFQTNWTDPGMGRTIVGFQTLTLRVSLQCGPSIFSCADTSPLNDPANPIDFSIALVDADGTLSHTVHARDFARLMGPVGSLSGFAASIERHPTLQSLRIPLEAFELAPGEPLRGVRFTFDRSASGAIYLANVRLDRASF